MDLNGFTATDTTKTFGTKAVIELKRAVEGQFTWSCRDSLPFISLFSDREHAENCGLKQPWLGHGRSPGSWSLHVINTTDLRETNHFFKLNDLVEEPIYTFLRVLTQHVRGAFMCLHRIPVTAIIESRNPTEIEEGELAYRIFLATVA